MVIVLIGRLDHWTFGKVAAFGTPSEPFGRTENGPLISGEGPSWQTVHSFWEAVHGKYKTKIIHERMLWMEELGGLGLYWTALHCI